MENVKKNNAAVFVARKLADGKKPNRLIDEKSPYLLQHAFNPVEWYPWGEAAFTRALQEDKPIFLSIGYSTCHWCHVMAHESFEDPEIAAILNQYFIPVKVDREERPDLDQIYMLAVQAMSGRGGWPMSIFLTPERQPIYAGTYFPPSARYGRPGFPQIMEHIHRAWLTDREQIVKRAGELATQISRTAANDQPDALHGDVSAAAAADFIRSYDSEHGGFGAAPKFPRPAVFNFLLFYGRRAKRSDIIKMVLDTLRKMASGGMCDQLGGGFHRYSVDARWLVPHFEKMLYDQAQLVVSYLTAYQISGDDFFKEVATHTLDYVLRDMCDEEGAFYSAEDADSPLPENHEQTGEGAFYLWYASEIRSILGTEANIFIYHYGIKETGNVTDDPQGEFKGKNIIYLARSYDDTALQFNCPASEIRAILANCREKLLVARRSRPRPHLDDKILASWNGLLISALARGYQITGERHYLAVADKAAEFLLDKMYDEADQTMMHRYREGETGIDGQLADYAFVTQGMLDLYEAGFKPQWLALARELSERQLVIFSDHQRGGFFECPEPEWAMSVKVKADYDGAEPAANSIAALNFLRLGRMFGLSHFGQIAEEGINAFAGQLNNYPSALPQMLVAYEFKRGSQQQLVIAGNRDANDTREMIAALSGLFLPDLVIMLADPAEIAAGQNAHPVFPVDMPMLDGRATAYLCENFACRRPTTEPAELIRMLTHND